jgi:hypothetical protein
MNTRRPRIIVTLLWYLLTFAPAASAECTWVLWKDDQSTDTRVNLPRVWQPLTAYSTVAECIKEIDIREADARKAKWDFYRQATTNLSMGQPSSSSPYRIVVGYQCFPDTIDPRGPKP